MRQRPPVPNCILTYKIGQQPGDVLPRGAVARAGRAGRGRGRRHGRDGARAAGAGGRHGAAAPLPRQRRAHHTAVLAPLPLRQRLLLQHAGDGAGLRDGPLGRRAVGPPGAVGGVGRAPGPRAGR